jgi:FMN phosphatase YigB (HAD superfamily)
MIRSIAFDVFDTLYPTGKKRLYDSFREAEQQVMRNEGIVFDSDSYWKAVQKTSQDIQTPEWKDNPLRFPIVLLQNLGIKKEGLAEKIGKEFSRVNKQYTGGNPIIFPEAKEIIPLLHGKKVILSIISDTEEDWIKHQLVRDGLSGYFSHYYLSFQIGYGKASGLPYLRFLEDMKKEGIHPSECVMVGDLPADMEAKKYGMKTILYNPTGRKFDHFSYPPDFTIQSHAELEKIID